MCRWCWAAAPPDLKIQMGGLDGRALQAGDVLTTGDFCLPIGDPTPWHIPPVTFAPPFTLRCIDGPQAADLTRLHGRIFTASLIS